MTPAHTAAHFSTLLALRSPTLCIRCQLRASRPFSTITPKLARRTWKQRLWRDADSQDPDNSELRKADGGLGEGEYKPAVTWDGLPSAGGNPGAEWEREHVWEGFMATVKLQSRQDISAAIHRALIEVFTLRDSGLETMVQNAVDDDRGIGAMSGATLLQAEDGTVRVEYASEELREEVIAALTTAPEVEPATLEEEVSDVEIAAEEDMSSASDVEAQIEEPVNAAEIRDEDVFEPEEQELSQSTATVRDNSPTKQSAAWLALSDAVPVEQWVNTTFPDPNIKFAILKRVMQLTGRRIPDPALQDIDSARALLGHLVSKPKPPKLAERLTLKEQLVELPNVQLRERRWTPIDKEKEVGRWKVIVKELKERDLPVTGH